MLNRILPTTQKVWAAARKGADEVHAYAVRNTYPAMESPILR